MQDRSIMNINVLKLFGSGMCCVLDCCAANLQRETCRD